LSLDFANNKYEVYEGPVDGLTQMPFNTALDFTRGSGATAQTAIGTIQEVLTDEQRLVGNREGLLIEEQRTNVITRSQPTVADNYWQALTDTTLSDVTLAGLPALRVTRDTGTGGLQALITNTQGNPNNVCSRTMIVRVSDPANQYLKLRIAGDSGFSYYPNDDSFHITFDLSSKTVVYAGSKAGTAEIKELSVGVFKLTLNQTYSSGVALAADGWAFRLSDQSDASDYNTPQVPQGSWFEFTACQREELVGFPSSYIPTAGTQVTRAADNCVRVLGDEFNPNQWSIYLDASMAENSNNFQYIFNLQGSGSGDPEGVQITNAYVRVRADNATTYLQLTGNNEGSHKYAIAFDGARYIIVRDGVSTGWAAGDPIDPTTAGFPLRLSDNSVDTAGCIYRDFRIMPTASSEAQLITLTGGT